MLSPLLVRLTFIAPTILLWGKKCLLCSTICTTSMSAVDMMPMPYIPAPNAIPTPTVAHRPADVVRPSALSLLTNMTPAPRKPMAETTLAAIREASTEIPSTERTSKNPYFDTIIIKAEAIATIMWVLTPALFCLLSLSAPIREPQIIAATRRNV